MEQKNLLLAIILSAIIMVGFQWYNAKNQSPELSQNNTDKNTLVTPKNQAPSVKREIGPGITPLAPSVVTNNSAVIPGTTIDKRETKGNLLQDVLESTPRIQIDSNRIKGSISLIGARIDELILKDYRETTESTSKNISLLHPIGTPKPYYADFGWQASGTEPPNPKSLWKASAKTLTPENPITLSWENTDGIKFIQEITLDSNYMFTITQRVENKGSKTISVRPWGRISRTSTPNITDFYILHEGLLGVSNGVLKEIDYDEIKDSKTIQEKSNGGWVGITDKYWLTALIPNQQSDVFSGFRYIQSSDSYQTDFVTSEQTIYAGSSAKTTNNLFAGAKDAELILDYRDNLNISRFDLAIDWGWFEILTKPIFFALLYFTKYLGNMGLSILLLTVLIKLAFFPLANKSYRAMSKMKILQPEMIKLRERFKDDKARMNQEVMKLYKREKANPAAGCLPILPQIPVFFALYKVVFVTIELRHAPFYGWIQDLSAADPLTPLNLFGLINWTPPEIIAIGVWPIIMGITMYAQQKLNPPPPDPMQAKIFMFLPVMFTVMLARFPAGLVIYWAWNNALSILQQYIIMRKAGAPIGSGKQS